MRPLVSIVIPTHNRAELVPRALRSVLAQSVGDWECLIVDDASTDDTSEVVADFSEPRFRYLRHDQNRGGSAARNTGIRAARGEYIAFLDSDDEWVPTKLEKQLAVFDSTDLTNLVLVSCGRTLTENGLEREVVMPSVRGWFLDNVLAGKPGNVDSTPTWLLRRVGDDFPPLFDERLPALQDLEYLIRVAEFGQVDYVPESLLIWHVHGGAHIHSPQNVYRARKMIAEKHLVALRAHRPQLAFLYQRIAASAGAFGEREECVRYLGRSVRVWPWKLGNYPRLGAAMIGAWPRSRRV